MRICVFHGKENDQILQIQSAKLHESAFMNKICKNIAICAVAKNKKKY